MRLRRAAAGVAPGPRRGPPPPMRQNGGIYDDDDDEDDYFDPASGPVQPMIDPENFDMMSVTSKKNRKASSNVSSASQFRKNPEPDLAPSRASRFRPNFGRNRSSQVMSGVPTLGDNILDDPLLGFTSNRYGTVDRGTLQSESRANSLTAARLDELQYNNHGPPPMGMNGNGQRRASQSPGNPYSPSIRGGPGRPSPPNGYPGGPMNGHMNGRPSPPNGMHGVQQPIPRYPPGHGNAVAPQQVEQHAGRGQW